MSVTVTNLIKTGFLKDAEFVVYNISRESVEEKDLTSIFELAEALKKLKKEARGKILLSFDGYDEDPRELYEINEVREFAYAVFEKYPYFVYFINSRPMPYSNLNLFLLCLHEVQTLSSDGVNTNITIKQVKPTAIRMVEEVAKYTASIFESDENVSNLLNEITFNVAN